MASVLDVGSATRAEVDAPARLLLQYLTATLENRAPEIHILVDVDVAGGKFGPFENGVDELLKLFQSTHMLGFMVGIALNRFICVWPPMCFGSKLNLWRIIGESRSPWNETLLDEIIKLNGIVYAVISWDETLGLEKLEQIDKQNFPWSDWRLVSARVRS